MKLDKKKILSQYDFFKATAVEYLNKGDIEISIKYCELAAHIGYKYNFRYCDDELESLIEKITNRIIPENIKYIPVENRVVFYDSFAVDNRNLTLQYIKAFVNSDFEVLFITPKAKIGNDILKELKSCERIKIFQIAQDSSVYNSIRDAINEVINFSPKYILEQFTPWDIMGIGIFNKIKNAERFLINLTDHAYWLGKCAADYFLEFRKYGCYLSLNERNILPEKLLFQPYYPVQPNKIFQGFSIEKGGNIFAFAGSNYYKIYGRKGVFMELAKSILDENKSVILLFAGNGNDRPIKSFIAKNKLEKRFILLGDRADVNEVFKNIDIYVNTYPMIGGLMSQYAAINNKPIIGYTDMPLYSFNDTEDFLQSKGINKLVKTTKRDFLDYFKKLVDDVSERNANIEATKDVVIRPDEFSRQLFLNMHNKQHIIPKFANQSIVNLSAISDLYIEMETYYLKEHSRIIWHILGRQLIKDNFLFGLQILSGQAVYKLNAILRTQFNF